MTQGVDTKSGEQATEGSLSPLRAGPGHNSAGQPDRPRFHLAFPVHDLSAARGFYGGLLGCSEGRSADQWVDFDFHGHQIVAHLAPEDVKPGSSSDVDGHQVPCRHFGLILEWEDWRGLAARLEAARVDFIMAPTIRFSGLPGEQATMFVRDPSGNALEFKAFRDDSQIFATA